MTSGNGLADEVHGQLVDRLEADTRLAHVEPLAGLDVGILEPFGLAFVHIDRMQIHGHVVLLRCQRGIEKRLLVVGVGKDLERDLVRDHAPRHCFDNAVGKVGHDGVAHFGDRDPAIVGKSTQIIFDRFRRFCPARHAVLSTPASA